MVYPHSLKYRTRKLLLLPLASHKVDTLPVLVISSSNSLLRLTQDLYSMSGIKITLPAIDAPPLLVSHYYCLLPLYSIQGVNIKRKIKIKKRKTAVFTAVLLLCRHRLIFPGRFQPSIVSTDELNYRVRDGNGWTLIAKDTDLRLRYCAFVSFSLAIIHARGSFVNSFLRFFLDFFIGTG